MQLSFDEMVMDMMAYKAKLEGPQSIAQSYVDLIKEFKNEDYKR